MSPSLQLLLYKNEQLLHALALDGPVELGRQDEGEPPPYARKNAKLVIAHKGENEISRRLLRAEPLPDGSVRLTNTGRAPLTLSDGRVLEPKQSAQARPPVVLNLEPAGRWACRLQDAATPPVEEIHSLPHATAPPRPPDPSSRLPSLSGLSRGGFDTREVMDWLDQVLGVLQAAADSDDFFAHAARAAVQMADLDSAQVLLLDERGAWKPCAAFAAAGGAAGPPSERVLEKVRREKRAFLRLPAAPGNDSVTLPGAEAIVAAPVLDRQENVLAALYGERLLSGMMAPGRPPLTSVEARLIEVLARGVAAGLARLTQERAALASRVRFEQFFTPELARRIASDAEELLQAREAEVSVLFCDVRGFSRISERLGPAATLEWTQDVLEAMSRCVLEQGGVLVDYIGDALMAVWGAPEEQPDHAARACRAALGMLAALPGLSQHWQGTVKEPTRLSIGVNTGRAQVGNTGSRSKFKYGALGNTVNLASRLQGATKDLKSPALISAATREALGEGFCSRKLGAIQVMNIAEPVVVHELLAPGRPDWPAIKEQYEMALDLFEMKEFALAARAMADWRVRHQEDGPALVLMYRAVRCLVEGPLQGHPVWALTEK